MFEDSTFVQKIEENKPKQIKVSKIKQQNRIKQNRVVENRHRNREEQKPEPDEIDDYTWFYLALFYSFYLILLAFWIWLNSRIQLNQAVIS